MDDLVGDYPGALSSPSTQVDGDLPNLTPSFAPQVTDLLTSTPSTSSLPVLTSSPMQPLTDSASSGLTDLGSINANGLVTFGEGIGSSLLGAFVTNPANAATQVGVLNSQAAIAQNAALTNAAISTQQTSQIFTYLIFGLVGFLIFSLLEKR